MNIFFLDSDPEICAQYHLDVHVRKMIIESAQLLCSAHHLSGTDPDIIPYKLTHPNHPSAKWVRESTQNYNWLCDLAIALTREYTYRTGKVHKSEAAIRWCIEHKPLLPLKPMTDFAIGFSKIEHSDCVTEDAVQSYRNYYSKCKRGYYRKVKCNLMQQDGTFAKNIYIENKWTNREVPEFMN